MMSEESAFPIRRILFALDHCAHEHGCVDYVADLAARLQAELHGVFIEDTDLLRSAGHPFVLQINLLTGVMEKLDSESTQEGLRSRARISEASLRTAATQRRVPWSFRVIRGRPSREVAAAAADVDLLVIQSGGSSRTAEWMARLGRTHGGDATRATVTETAPLTRSILVIRPGPIVRNPIL